MGLEFQGVVRVAVVTAGWSFAEPEPELGLVALHHVGCAVGNEVASFDSGTLR